MANYKKLTDVEVMEEVSENSMALVNENGVLKQVPCGAGFGGGGGVVTIIRDETGTYSSATTYDEFKAMVDNREFPTVTYWEPDGSYWYVYTLQELGCFGTGYTLRLGNNGSGNNFILQWSPDNTFVIPELNEPT